MSVIRVQYTLHSVILKSNILVNEKCIQICNISEGKYGKIGILNEFFIQAYIFDNINQMNGTHIHITDWFDQRFP